MCCSNRTKIKESRCATGLMKSLNKLLAGQSHHPTEKTLTKVCMGFFDLRTGLCKLRPEQSFVRLATGLNNKKI